LNLEHIKALDALVKTGSISEAAERLHKTQPAISMALKKLEQNAGFNLIDRSKYRLTLTEQGKTYYQKCKVIIEQLNILQSLSNSFQQGQEHKVVVAMEGIIDQQQILTKLQDIQTEFPDTELHFVGVHLLHGLSHITEKEADLAITPWLPTFSKAGDFDSKLINQFSFTLCGHKSLFERFGVTHANDITEDMLKQLPQITPTQIALDLEDTQALKPIGRSLVKIDDVHCYLIALKSRLGWGPLPHSAWSEDMASDFYRLSVFPDMSSWCGEVRIVKSKNRILGPVAQKIWDRL
jgi:DNA-binding transcriptional LysR family regulator